VLILEVLALFATAVVIAVFLPLPSPQLLVTVVMLG